MPCVLPCHRFNVHFLISEQDQLQLAATRLSSYVPDSVAGAFAQYGVTYENTRWDDDVPSKDVVNMIDKKPKFHLLIPANKPSVNLCRTVLSAAILNYPPSTLISYGTNRGRKGDLAGDVYDTFDFLLGKEAHDDDLILVVNDGMPPQSFQNTCLTISRYTFPTPCRSNIEPFLPWHARHRCQITGSIRNYKRH